MASEKMLGSFDVQDSIADDDLVLGYDKSEGKVKNFKFGSGIWNWFVNKLSTAVVAKLTTTDKTMIGAINELNSNLPIIESVNKVITAESEKNVYDLGINANSYMIISIQPIDRNGWIYTVSRGVSGTEGTNNWSLCFVNNRPVGAFTFKIITLKIK